MTADLNEDNEMKQDIDEQYTDIESYRQLVKRFFSLRNFQSALFWAEKVVVLSDGNPKDIYQQAQCMFLLKEYNRAAHVIRKSELEKTNLLCTYLLIECLYASKDYQEALNLMNSIEIEDLSASLRDESELELNTDQNEQNKNVGLKFVYRLGSFKPFPLF